MAPRTILYTGVNVPAFLNDVNTVLRRASSVGVSGAGSLSSGLSPASRQRIAAAIRNPSFDVWTGNSDKTVRRLTVGLTVLITGQLASELGGVRSADVGLTMIYANLNQPQTIVAPKAIRPFCAFQAKVAGFIQTIQGAAAGLLGTGSSGDTNGGGAGTSTNVQGFGQCIQQAGGNVSKLQKCASLLGSGG